MNYINWLKNKFKQPIKIFFILERVTQKLLNNPTHCIVITMHSICHYKVLLKERLNSPKLLFFLVLQFHLRFICFGMNRYLQALLKMGTSETRKTNSRQHWLYLTHGRLLCNFLLRKLLDSHEYKMID